MSLALNKSYTIEDIYRLPEGQRAELIDGQLYMMAPPSRRHQEIAGELFASIRNYLRAKGGTGKPYIAPFAVFLSGDDTTYVEPDISVICDKNKLDNRGCNGAPDWVIEVVSPSTQRMDYMIKLFQYQRAGVLEYWIVDPRNDTVIVYDFAKQDRKEYTFRDRIPVGIYEDFEIDFASVILEE